MVRAASSSRDAARRSDGPYAIHGVWRVFRWITSPDSLFFGLQRVLIAAARSVACAILDHTAF